MGQTNTTTTDEKTAQNGQRPSWKALLTNHDASLIEASAISPEVAEQRGYYTALDRRALSKLGFSLKQQGRFPALILPFYDVTGKLSLFQMRPHVPHSDANGRAKKYEFPFGATMVIDVPPAVQPKLADPSKPLWITEGVRKADSAVSHGLCCIDVPGVWNWRGKNVHGGLAALPDWESIALNERVVNLVFDSDVMTKLAVHAALARLGAFLTKRGAKVCYAYLPSTDGAKVGLDDFFAAGGTVEELVKLVRSDLLPSPGQTPTEPGSALALDDFFAHLPDHTYIHRPTRKPWLKAGVDSAIPSITVGTTEISASRWLDQNRAVHQKTWAPGLDEILDGWLMNEGGWSERPGSRIYNTYLPPTLPHGDASKAGRWIEHVKHVYPDDAEHIIPWFAQRVQEPAVKINHALVLGGAPGIGKDTMLVPVAHAVGPWNVSDVSPSQVTGRFNRFLRSVILRVSEARDLGDVNRYGFYEAMKAYEASPPETLRIDEKYLGEYSIWNAVSVLYTTNNRTTGLYLPPDDRRHFVAWSERVSSDFPAGYFSDLYKWFENGGNRHVAAYLATLNLEGFDPKAPPRKTPAFWAMVDASRAPEESELADLLEKLGSPPAITLNMLTEQRNGSGFAADFELATWLADRRNRRQVPHRMETVGYVGVRNDAAKDGLWKVDERRQVVYARVELSRREQIAAAQSLGSR